MNVIRNEDGAALLSVLLLVSVMSAAMVTTFGILGYITRYSTFQFEHQQVREYAKAAEIVGAEQALKLSRNKDVAALAQTIIPEKKISYEIEGGIISGELVEYSNCFNLSSLVRMNGGNGYEINIRSYDQFVRLLVALGVGETRAAALASSLVDWQDTDEKPMTSGAESFSYTQLEVPYRSANYPISQIEELRLVKGYTPELLDALAPFSCVDPTSMETVINLNAVRSDQVPIVHALLGLPISIDNVSSVLETRPMNGFDHIARFWEHDHLKNREIDSEVRKQFSLTPQRYKIIVDVNYHDAHLHQESLIRINNDNSYSLINRKYGAS